MINRIKEVARYYGLTSTAFADQVEIPRPVISHIFSERNRPSLEVVQKIGLAFPEVDLSWLLYGKGEMLKKIAQQELIPELYSTQPKNQMMQSVDETIDKEPGQDQILPLASKSISLPIHNKKKTVKIVFLYEDNTFEEFFT